VVLAPALPRPSAVAGHPGKLGPRPDRVLPGRPRPTGMAAMCIPPPS
jgi:hypothetical protein